MLSDVAITSISSILPFAFKNISMTVFRNGSLAVCSSPSFELPPPPPLPAPLFPVLRHRIRAMVRLPQGCSGPAAPAGCGVQILHSNLASVKLDAAAVSIVKAAYAFVALQGETVNSTIAMQTEKQRRRIKSARVAPKPGQGPGAESVQVRRWWVYDSDRDSRAATTRKHRVVLLRADSADTCAGAPVDANSSAKAPRAPPRQLVSMRTTLSPPRQLVTMRTTLPPPRQLVTMRTT
jgi:hypothetical protein